MAPTGRPATSRPLSPGPGDHTLRAVIAEFLAEPATGADRELRSALGHVDAELGSMPIANVRPRNLMVLLDDLGRAGLSERREAAVVDALHAVFAYAVARRLVTVDPTPGPARAAQPATAPTPTPTPTFTMLALGARVAFWTTWMITIGFFALLLILLVELG